MPVKIRLSRAGRRNSPFFRIVATDSRNKRDGRFLENLGAYNPLTGEIVQFHAERIDHWVGHGALLSDTVKKIQRNFKRGSVTPEPAVKAQPIKKTVEKPEKAKPAAKPEPAAEKKAVKADKDAA